MTSNEFMGYLTIVFTLCIIAAYRFGYAEGKLEEKEGQDGDTE